MNAPLPFIAMAPPPDELWIDDLAEIVTLHERVHEAAPVPGLFARETAEFFRRHIEEDGRIFGLRDRGQLIAYGVLGLPRQEDETHRDYNFGAWAGLPETALGRVAHIDGIAVRPDHRGHNLHGVMLKRRILAALECRRDLIYTTVAPANLASLGNLLSAGFVIVALLPLFGGQDRYIMAWSDRPARPQAESRLVRLDDRTTQAQLLQDGFVAIGAGKQADGPHLRFLPEADVTAPWSGLAPPSRRR